MIVRVAGAAGWLAPATASPSAAGAPPNQSAIHLDVPAIRQAPERCGPAALSMVLRFYGAAPAALAEADRAYDPAIRGALITDLRDAASRAGYPATLETPGEEGLAALLREGVPPILLFESGIGPIGRGHYGVVAGWDPARRVYLVNDGRSRPRTMGAGELTRRWRAAGGQALIVRPKPS